jgi:hypothetical protein
MISMDHINVGKMKQSASEMLSFIRYFGLLIGDFVPTGEPIWDLYLTLRRVLDITLSTSHEVNNCMLLKTAVGEMNELYLKLSKNVLKPKFHFLTHYPTMIKNMVLLLTYGQCVTKQNIEFPKFLQDPLLTDVTFA